ncbi:DUF5324 family protein [Streptomyces chumphonensis]|uniref:DUF5324 family protein n=1 Tax=Streptomyces chumphonensis TaxID=1214925 RepID=A0A927F3Y5_9ACTN|nr:DUF5324 family protein [Streptomyces chumphonensis]MBD3934302.1 DUF5324 family protein [Streptomyces chumphonensis]
MTRKDSVRAATGTAKENVRHAAEVVGPRVGLAARQAQHTAREQYAGMVAPRLAHARTALPPAVDDAAKRAAKHSRKAAKEARGYAKEAAAYAAPRVEAARAAAAPAREEAMARSAAALAALRGEVTAKEVRKITRKRARRAACGRGLKRLTVLGLVAGAGYAAWRWWDQQANPDWLVEPPAPTDVSEGGVPSDASSLDPEVEAKQAEEAGDAAPSEGGKKKG